MWMPSLVALFAFGTAGAVQESGGRTTLWWVIAAVTLAVAFALRGGISPLGLGLALIVVGATKLPGVYVLSSSFDAVYLLVLLIPLLPLGVVACDIDPRWSWFGLLLAAAVTAGVAPDPPWATSSYSVQETLARYVLNLGVPVIAAASAWLAGYAMRVRQQYAETTWQRALTLERAREAETANAISRERDEIARELHDVVTHSVAVMVVQASAADAVWERDPEQARAALRAVEESGRTVMSELREMLRTMRSDDDGSRARTAQPDLTALDDLVGRIESAGVRARFQRTGDLDLIPATAARSLLRIAQESVTNALRHAKAQSIEIALSVAADCAHLSVADDGVGLTTTAGEAEDAGGYGLIGMRERAAAIGAELAISEPVAGGTRVEVTVLLRRPESM
jgi:signal transduction histidine kinase